MGTHELIRVAGDMHRNLAGLHHFINQPQCSAYFDIFRFSRRFQILVFCKQRALLACCQNQSK